MSGTTVVTILGPVALDMIWVISTAAPSLVFALNDCRFLALKAGGRLEIELVIVIATTVAALVLFVSDRLRVDLVALIVMVTLLVTGVLTPAEALSGFSNEATITIAALFVLSDGFRKTGVLEAVGDKLARLFAVSEVLALMTMMTAVGFMSAFINNTAIVAMLLPVMMSMCRKNGIAPTRVLMPLSFAAMFGGLCTLVGTSTNLLVSAILDDHGMRPIGMFETAVPGLIFFLFGSLYMVTVGRWLTPARGAETDVARAYEVPTYVAEAVLLDSAPNDVTVEALTHATECVVVSIFRDDSEISPTAETVLVPGDVVRIRGALDDLRGLGERDLLALRTGRGAVRREASGRHRLFEAVVDIDSELAGKTLEETDFPRLFTAQVLAIRSRGELHHSGLTSERLRGGDVLLMEAHEKELERLQRHPAFVAVTQVKDPGVPRASALPTGLLIAFAVGLAAVGLLPIVVTASAAAVLLILGRVLSIEEAYDAIDWQVIVLLAGILPLGIALEKVGGATWIARFLVEWLGPMGPLALLAGFYLVAMVLTSLISNQATAILLTPIALGTAASVGIDPRVLVMAIAFAASASFATPVGYQTNVLIFGAGDYRFTDFIKVGLPLNLLFWAVAVYYLPSFWHF